MSVLRRPAAVFLAAIAGFLCFAPRAAADAGFARAGDIDGDGRISAADARVALRAAVGLSLLADEIQPFADADGDGSLTAADARLVLRAAVGLEPESALAGFYAPWAYTGESIPWQNKTVFPETRLTVGETLNLSDRFARRAGVRYAWRSSNPEAASVSDSGAVTANAKGFACVYVTVGANRWYYPLRVVTPTQEKIYALQEKYPHGYYWNAHRKSARYPEVSEIPCDDHASYTYAYCIGQCAGFASLLSAEVYGWGAPMRYGLAPEDVGIGDYLRCLPHHSVFVIDRVEAGEPVDYDYFLDANVTAEEACITVAECNWDSKCGIGWGRRIPLSRLSIDPDLSYSREE